MKKHHRIAPEVKEQIINRIKHDGISVAQAAEEHGGLTYRTGYAILTSVIRPSA